MTPQYGINISYIAHLYRGMNIIQPPRIQSLGGTVLRVIEHVGRKGQTRAYSLDDVYPFDTLAMIRQRILLEGTGTKNPYLFLAVPATKSWRPLEFVWPFATGLADPFEVFETVNEHLMDGEVQKPVFPTLLNALTFEAIGAPREIHVWRLEVLRGEAKGKGPVSAAVFGGFYRLYFPTLRAPADLNSVVSDESAEVMLTFHEQRHMRLGRLDTLLAAKGGEGARLRELRMLRITLPKRTLRESLEIAFYEMSPTKQCPVIRFFSRELRAPPLLKLATGPTGIPTITDTKLLKALLADEPTAQMGGVLVAKAPLTHPRAPFGAAWTLKMFEDGSGELSVGAPRRDAPLHAPIVEEALRAVSAFLAPTPWAQSGLDDAAVVTELTAAYEYSLQQQIRKPTRAELRKRGAAFTPLFGEGATLTGDSAALSLRWKAVSNFHTETDPIMAYIGELFVRDAHASVEAIPSQIYVGALAREFGLGPAEAAAVIERWVAQRAEYVVADADAPERALPANALGASVGVYNVHPKYVFQLVDVGSLIDLQRILSVLEVWVATTADELLPAATQTAEVAMTAVEPTIVEAAPEEFNTWYDAMDMYGAEEATDNIETVQTTQPAPAVAVVAPLEPTEVNVRYPEPVRDDEAPLPTTEGFFLTQLKQRNLHLFSYGDSKDPRVRPYSRSCQNNANKQPNVMSPESYRRIRAMYGDTVHWLEAPLSTRDLLAITVASKMIGERAKMTQGKRTLQDLVDLEKRALALGYPIKDGKSIADHAPVWKSQKMPGRDAEYLKLQTYQASKPLWIVVRAGTRATAPNYYICAEYWCVRDDLPITDAAFVAAKGCPFCGGKLISSREAPRAGETVLKRGPSAKGSTQVARYAGFLSGLSHPDRFALPCCFVDPNNMAVPEGSEAAPAAIITLPAVQLEGERGTEAERAAADAAEEAAATDPATSTLMAVFDDVKVKLDFKEARFRGVPATAYRFLDKELTKVELRAKRLLRTYILEATSFPLEEGKVGIVPAPLDTFLGQDRRQYLENPKHGEIYTHPTLAGRAFFRLGFGVKIRNRGDSLLQLIAYARSVVSYLMPPLRAAVQTPEEILTDMFETNEVLTFHAWQQANYGTLPLEYADIAGTRVVADGEFQAWCGRMGIPLPSQRAHALELYKAWLNFQAAVRDRSAYKDLRLWEHLFTAPGLFTTTGVVLAVLTEDDQNHIQLRCPALGVSPHDQQVRPPLMFLYEDRRTRLVEPLVLFEGPDRVVGAIDPESDVFGALGVELREPLSAFYSEFLNPRQGCGRPRPSPHPWQTDDAPATVAATALPRLGPLLATLRSLATVTKPDALLRDRSRRLLGVLVGGVYVPAIDDGTIDVSLGSLYEMDARPPPPLVAVLTLLAGTADGVRRGLASVFPTLAPAELRSRRGSVVALELRGGAIIPIEPLAVGTTVSHPAFASLKGSVAIDVLPWEDGVSDAAGQRDATAVLQNPEEALEEAYQHLRLSMSEWLTDGIRAQLRLLKAARRWMPLFELRKRADLLLMPVLSRWIHVGDQHQTGSSIMLRRNCLKIRTEGECQGACVWVPEDNHKGRCAIHAAPTERFVDPVQVLTARLVDELLRTHGDAEQVLTAHVPRLVPPAGIARTDGAVVMAVSGRGSIDTYRALGLEGRIPTDYARGLVIAEEMGQEDVGMEPTARGIPLTWSADLKHMTWSADVSRDVGAQQQVFWSAFLGQPWSEVSSIFKGRRGEGDLFEMLVAKKPNTVILTTRDGPRGYQLTAMYGAQGASNTTRYLILDPWRLPLTNNNRETLLAERELPSAVREWMDAFVGVPAEVEAPADTKEEEIEMDEEEVLAYQRIHPNERAPVGRPEVAPKPAVVRAKPCKEGEERSRISKKCVKKCKEGEVRDEASGRCKKERGAAKVATEDAPEAPEAPKQVKKPCADDEERSDKSGKCVKKCGEGEERNPTTGRCRKTRKNRRTPQAPQAPQEDKQPPQPQPKQPKPCPEGEERSAKTRKCIKKCREGEVRNPDTGRCKKGSE